jgi:hypothetical protein
LLKTLKIAIAVAGGLALACEATADDQGKDKAAPQVPPISNSAGVDPHDGPGATGPKNTLRWQTNGLNNYGYDVFRAESESGPFEKINSALLPGNGTKGASSQRFEYVDTKIDPHKAYWYYVESIDLMGKRAKFTPTLKAAPKLPAEPQKDAPKPR